MVEFVIPSASVVHLIHSCDDTCCGRATFAHYVYEINFTESLNESLFSRPRCQTALSIDSVAPGGERCIAGQTQMPADYNNTMQFTIDVNGVNGDIIMTFRIE